MNDVTGVALDNGTTAPAAPTTSPVSARPRRLTSRLSALIVALVASVSVLLLTPGSAQAYTATAASGSIGTFTFGYTGPAIVSIPGYAFDVPVMIVQRNAAVRGYQEEIQATFTIQRWNGSAWAFAGGATQRAWSGFASNDAVVLGNTRLVSQLRTPGYYRVVTTITWGGAAVPNGWSNYVSGQLQFAPVNNVDLNCTKNASHCVNYGSAYGGMYVTG